MTCIYVQQQNLISNHIFSHPEGPLISQVSTPQMRSKFSSLPLFFLLLLTLIQ